MRGTPGESGLEQALLSVAILGPSGFIAGTFLAFLIQIRRALRLPIWSKIAYGLILLMLLVPFLNSLLSISSFVLSAGAAFAHN